MCVLMCVRAYVKERGMIRTSGLIPGCRVVCFFLSKKLYLVYPAVLIGGPGSLVTLGHYRTGGYFKQIHDFCGHIKEVIYML